MTSRSLERLLEFGATTCIISGDFFCGSYFWITLTGCGFLVGKYDK